MEKTWMKAIIRVLEEEGSPMHYTDIATAIQAGGYHDSGGINTSITVNSTISTSLKQDGDKSPFIKTDMGTFALRSLCKETPPPLEETGLLPPEKKLTNSVIRSFGMYWQRDSVLWKNEPRLLGKLQPGMAPVDFSKQRGIYILYDYHSVVYVGRSIDRPLGKRLFEHTIDRLAGRWNRFTWLGLSDVSSNGSLVENTQSLSQPDAINLLEAVLIEVLEPPQNRRRGDYMANEYIQEADSELREREIYAFLEQKLRKTG